MFKFRLSDKSRKFAKDVGGIVLGVLIALGIGEVADAVRKRVNANIAANAVRADMLDNYAVFEVEVLSATCVEGRIAALTAELEHARSVGQLRDIGDIGFGASSTFRTGAWDRAVANGDTLYMSDQKVAGLADYHDLLRIYRAYMEDALRIGRALEFLSDAPGAIDDNTLSSARITVAELKYRTSSIAYMATYWFRCTKSLACLPLTHPSTASREVARIWPPSDRKPNLSTARSRGMTPASGDVR